MYLLMETGSPVLGFCLNSNRLFALCGNDLIKSDSTTGIISGRKTVLAKDGKARLIRSNSSLLAVSDFCMLYIYRQDTLEKVAEWQLGTDLSSDICGLHMDDGFVFAGIRNGRIARIRLMDLSVETFAIGTASTWSLADRQNMLYAGTVDGKLLCIDKDSMQCVRSLTLSRQNIRSLYISGDTLYAAGQDKKLYVIDLNTFEFIRKQNGLHRMMFDIIGLKGGILYTVSHPACEICAWNDCGENTVTIPCKLRLSGSSLIEGNRICISSRSINGIACIEIS